MNNHGVFPQRAIALLCAIVLTSISIVCTGCGEHGENSQKWVSQTETAPMSTTGPLPHYEFVEAKAMIDRKALGAKVRALIAANDYDGLDKFAADLRRKGTIFPGGMWHLDRVYDFLVPSERDTDQEWQQRLSQLQAWARARPDSITARVAQANTMLEYAWRGRSNKPSRIVSQSQWKMFAERLDKARTILTDAERLKQKCPCWYRMMMTLGLGQGWELKEMDRLLNESVKAKPNYLAVYFRKAIYLQPRWSGQPGDWQKFAKESADRVGGLEGDKLYARIIWNEQELAGDEYSNDFSSGRLSWETTKRGFRGIMADYADDLGPPTEFCYLSVLAGDKKQAKELFEKLGDRVMLGIWKTPEKFKQSHDWAFGAM